jgi:hypothetical protein
LGVPLTSAVAEFVIVSLLGGKQLKRSQVVNFVERYHAEHGGLPCQAADIARTVKKALDTIKAKGGAQNPSVGWWRISSLIDGRERRKAKVVQTDYAKASQMSRSI